MECSRLGVLVGRRRGLNQALQPRFESHDRLVHTTRGAPDRAILLSRTQEVHDPNHARGKRPNMELGGEHDMAHTTLSAWGCTLPVLA
jgi:hypothetical protein